MMRLCAIYLSEAKRDNHALDPVAHFHLVKRGKYEADQLACGYLVQGLPAIRGYDDQLLI